MDVIKDFVFFEILFMFLFWGHCKAGGRGPRSEVDRTQNWLLGPHPECKFHCHGSKRKRSCGSNGRTYIGECEAQRAKCLDPMLTFKPGKCNEATCNYARDHAIRKFQAESRTSGYVPNCTADGHYTPKQCDLVFHICWCVNPDGKLIQGTDVENAEPTCTSGNVRRSTENCSPSSRATFIRNIRNQIMRDYRKASPRAEVPPNGSELLRLALRWKFEIVDTNKDNEVSLRDIRSFLKRMPERQCASAFMKECDSDHNHKVSSTEWTDCLFTPLDTPNRIDPTPSAPTPPTTNILTPLDDPSAQCPTEDRDELIERIRAWIFNEPERALTDFSTTSPVNQQLVAISAKFSQLDKDKNGSLIARELKILRRKFKKYNFKKCFMFVCDKNDDDILSAEEFSDCLNTEKQPNCTEERIEALKYQKAQDNIYVPECDETNRQYFNQIQCHGATGYCWCANRDTGRPVPGTSTRGDNPECGGTTSSVPSTTTTPMVRAIQGCDRTQDFITSVQKALVKKYVQSQRASMKNSSLR